MHKRKKRISESRENQKKSSKKHSGIIIFSAGEQLAFLLPAHCLVPDYSFSAPSGWASET
jgi:hypothetical protein